VIQTRTRKRASPILASEKSTAAIKLYERATAIRVGFAFIGASNKTNIVEGVFLDTC
jgi:hypothetical protein